MLLFDPIRGGLRDRDVFLESLLAAGLGITMSVLVFEREASLVSVFLAAFAQAHTVEALLDRNRRQIWDLKMPPGTANRALAQSLSVIFFGVFTAYLIAVQVAPAAHVGDWFARQIGKLAGGSIRDVHFGSFGALFGNNAIVLLVSFILAVLYRHGGMLLVLGWNASRWGVIFSYVALRAGGHGALGTLARTLLCIAPHLVLEALAYVLVAMGAVFLSKALEKYEFGSDAFRRVGWAVVRLAGLSLVVLAVAAALETLIAPKLVAALF